MLDLPAQSLAQYTFNPCTQPMDVGELPLKTLADHIQQEYGQPNPTPEAAALTFYGLNHAMHIINSHRSPWSNLEPDLQWVAEQHMIQTNAIAKRMLCHVIMAVVVETQMYMGGQDPAYHSSIERGYGAEFAHFIKNSSQAKALFFKMDTTCGNFARGMISSFAFSNWPYRKPWTKISSLIAQCIDGSLSLEQFTDQAFSTCHWGGSILNKCHLFKCNTEELFHILDIQDSGQILHWIKQHPNKAYVSADLLKVQKIISKHFPQALEGKLDMGKIKASATRRDQYKKSIAQAVQQAFNAGRGGGQSGQDKPVQDSVMVKANNILFPGMK